jgi:hypothetical protein
LDTGITVSLADFGGIWKIIGFDADSMELTQAGNHVYGTYNTHQGQGTIDGIINTQDLWIGTWYEPFSNDAGCFSVVFSNDTSHLVGSWMYGYPNCNIYPDYEGDLVCDYYGPCHNYYGGGDGYFQGEKVVTGNTTTNA